MERVLIVDDKKNRMRDFLSKDEKILDYINYKIDEGLIVVRDSLPEEDVCEYVSKFGIVAIHSSYWENYSFKSELYEYIIGNEKYLIKFSGGITQNTIHNNGRSLDVDVRYFYSGKLKYFLENYFCGVDLPQPLLFFLYGDSWRLSLYLEYRHLVWQKSNDSLIKSRTRNLRRVLGENAEDIDKSIEEEIKRALLL